MKYIGNKSRLLDFIYQAYVEENLPSNGTFVDLFGGTGSVGYFFKSKGFKIIANDFMTYSYLAMYSHIYLNKIPSFSRISSKGIDEVLEILDKLLPIKGYIYENFAPSGKQNRMYFSDKNAQKIDAIREQIYDWGKKELITNDENNFLLSILIDAADFVANISGTYGAYLKIWRSMALKDLRLKTPVIINNNKQNEVYQLNANELIKKITADVIYLDPPYNQRQYASNFHVLESIAIWDKQKLVGKTGQRDYSTKKSDYSLKAKANKAFENLINDIKAKYVILSYNNEGIIPRDFIIDTLSKFGEIKEYVKDYRRFRTERDHSGRQYKNVDDTVYEHLFIVKKT